MEGEQTTPSPPAEMEGEQATTRPVGRPSSYDPKFCDMVEAEMAKGYSLTAFAGIIGVCRDTLDEWKRAHPDFSVAVSRAKAKRLLQWERAAMKVAKDGGGPGTATVIVFGLKNMGGDEWSTPDRQELTGKDRGPVQVVIDKADFSL